MRAASVLPLKSQPVVSGKNSNVGLDKLHDRVVEEPVWVLNDMVSPGFKVVRLDELSQLWPLEVWCTVGEEDGTHTKCVTHKEQTTLLMLSLLLGAPNTEA